MLYGYQRHCAGGDKIHAVVYKRNKSGREGFVQFLACVK